MKGSPADPEGATPLDPDEMLGLRPRHVSTRGELDELEQYNIQQALRWLPGRRRFDILTESSLRQLHKRMFGDVWKWAGKFRLTGKNIGLDPRLIQAELRKLLDDARYWAANGTYPPLEAAARFHHRLVQIHLFPNGNGRHARIATDLYLEEYFSHAPISWEGGPGERADGFRRLDYLQALRAADRHDIEPLLRFVGGESGPG